MAEAKKHLIIGSGSAALSALEKIRSLNQEDEIRLVSTEDCLPYSPTSLPYLLAGRIKEENIWVKDEAYFKEMKATLARGKEVVKVIPGKKQVVYADGDSEQYDDLLITTGSDSVKPKIKCLDEVGFLGFHTLRDCRELLHQLKNKRSVAIYGGGLIAIELAMALLERGYEVKLVVRSRILRGYFDQEVGAIVNDIFVKQGAQIISGREVSEMRRNKGKIQVRLSDDGSLDADIFVAAVGVNPRASFLDGSGIKVNRGVLVDSRMQTNIECIYAAGDVAEAIDFFTKQPGINPIIPSAVAQGKVAGANMAGEATNYEGWISMNAFSFFGNVASSVGLSMPQGSEQVMQKSDDKKRYFKRLVFRGDYLIGAMFLNEEVDPGVIRYLIEHKVPIDEHKELLFEKTKEVSRWLMLKTEEAQSKF